MNCQQLQKCAALVKFKLFTWFFTHVTKAKCIQVFAGLALEYKKLVDVCLLKCV